MLLVAASLFINYRGAHALETWSWARSTDLPRKQRRAAFVSKLWDWRDPQFLAGLIDRRMVNPKEATPSAPPPDRSARPAKVLRPKVDALAGNEVRVAWRMDSGVATSFVVQMRSAADRRFKKIAVVPAGVHELVVRDLAPGASYTFRVAMRAGKRRLKLSKKVRVSLPPPAEGRPGVSADPAAEL